MAYTYQVSFDLAQGQLEELKVGASVERVLAYLRILLPNEPGFMSARAYYSIDDPDRSTVVFQSSWVDWEHLLDHKESALLEDKVLVEFAPTIHKGALAVRTFADVD